MNKYDEVRLLFDSVIARLKESHGPRFREFQIFNEVLGETQETQEAFSRFLHDVSTCPLPVIQWCQERINTTVQRK